MTSVLRVCLEQSFLRCGGLWSERKRSREEILAVSPPGLTAEPSISNHSAWLQIPLPSSPALLTLTENEQEKKRGKSWWIINDENMNTLAFRRPFMASNF